MSPRKLSQLKEEGRRRVVIERLTPEIDAGRHPAKRVVGQHLDVEVDVFADGHESVSGDLLYRGPNDKDWYRVALTLLDNDRYTAAFPVTEMGIYQYTVEAWADAFATWRRDLEKRRAAEQDLAIPLEVGARLVEDAAERCRSEDRKGLLQWAQRLRTGTPSAHDDGASQRDPALLADIANEPGLVALMRSIPPADAVRRHPRVLEVLVERPRAAVGAWYEFFPRSCGKGGRHGTFADCHERLEYVARLGFDVVYLPPFIRSGG